MDQSQSDARIQYFFVTIAKHIFYHERYGLVHVWDPVRLSEAKTYGLRPFFLYALSVAHLSIRWLCLSPQDRPRALLDVLCEAWKEGLGLRGSPDILIVNHHLAAASPTLAKNLAAMGVTLKVDDGHDRRPRKLQSVAQDVVFELLWNKKEKESNLEEALSILKDLSKQQHEKSCLPLQGCLSMQKTKALRRWLDLPKRDVPLCPNAAMDWTAGDWVTRWEWDLPPRHEHFFKKNLNKTFYSLVSGSNAEDDKKRDIEDVLQTQDELARFSKCVASCFPSDLHALSGMLDVPLRHLDWFFGEKYRFDESQRALLADVLSLEKNPKNGHISFKGPYFLEAKNGRSIKDIAAFFIATYKTKGFEIIPQEGQADNTWRYFLFTKQADLLMLIRGKCKAFNTKRLPKILTDYLGVCAVSRAFYDDVVQTYSRTACDPKVNRSEAQSFVNRNKAFFTALR